MKKIHFSLVLLVLLSVVIMGCGTTSPAPAPQPRAVESNPTLTIVNNTGGMIWFVYMSPSTDTTWGDDWLADDQVLPNGQSVTVILLYPLRTQNMYDIMLRDPDGNTYTKYGVTLTGNDMVIFNADDLD
jgi:hypothetical protein